MKTKETAQRVSDKVPTQAGAHSSARLTDALQEYLKKKETEGAKNEFPVTVTDTKISVEGGYKPEDREIVRTLFGQGTAKLQIPFIPEQATGIVVDGRLEHSPVYIRGLIDKPFDTTEEGITKPSPVAATLKVQDPTPLSFAVEGQTFHLQTANTETQQSFRLEQPKEDNTTSYSTTVTDQQGRQTELKGERFIHYGMGNVVVQRFSVTPKYNAGEVAVVSGIIDNIQNSGDEEFGEQLFRNVMRQETADGIGMIDVGESINRKHRVAVASKMVVYKGDEVLDPSTYRVVTEKDDKNVMWQKVYVQGVTAGDTITAEKVTVMDWSKHGRVSAEALAARATKKVAELPDWQKLYDTHAEAYRKQNEATQIEIEGDEKLKNGVALAISKLNQMYGESDDGDGEGIPDPFVGARSNGEQIPYGGPDPKFWEGYDAFGRFLTDTRPDQAKRLFEATLDGLDEAKNNARRHFLYLRDGDPKAIEKVPEYVFKQFTEDTKAAIKDLRDENDAGIDVGANIPWEVEEHGRNRTPKFLRNKEGGLNPIRTGEMEIHNIMTIAQGWEYYIDRTGDEDSRAKFLQYLAETAKFLSLRVANRPDGKFGIDYVIGANEYRHNGENDVAYVNTMAAWHLRTAAEQIREHHDLMPNYGPDVEKQLDRFEHIADNMVLPQIDDTGAIEEFAGHSRLMPLPAIDEITKHIPTGELEEWIKKQGIDLADGHKLTKQPCTILIAKALDRRNAIHRAIVQRQIKEHNGSTLNTSTLGVGQTSLAEAFAGNAEGTLDYLNRAISINENSTGKLSDGFPVANAAHIRAAVVEGFGGLMPGETFTLFPVLPSPDVLSKLAFHVKHHNNDVRVEIRNTHEEKTITFTVTGAEKGGDFPVELYGTTHHIQVGDTFTIPLELHREQLIADFTVGSDETREALMPKSKRHTSKLPYQANKSNQFTLTAS